MNGKGTKILVLHRSIHRVLHDHTSNSTVRFSLTTKHNAKLNSFRIIVLYCCDIFWGKDLSKFLRCLLESRTCVQCLELIRTYTTAQVYASRTMVDTRQERTKRAALLIRSLILVFILRKKNREKQLCNLKKLWENCQYRSGFSTEEPQLTWKNVLTNEHTVLGFEPFCSNYLGMSKVLKEYIFTSLGYDGLRSHSEKKINVKVIYSGANV